MPTNWYFENCPVQTSVNDITFRVTLLLLLHDGKNDISYSLQLFPFPVKMGYKASLKVTHQTAYSSISGIYGLYLHHITLPTFRRLHMPHMRGKQVMQSKPASYYTKNFKPVSVPELKAFLSLRLQMEKCVIKP